MGNAAKERAISPAVKSAVRERDSIDGWPCCIWCGSPYAEAEAHFISRSQGGLGIEENILTLCRRCHFRFDHTADRAEMQAYFRKYLRSKYPDWNEATLIQNRKRLNYGKKENDRP